MNSSFVLFSVNPLILYCCKCVPQTDAHSQQPVPVEFERVENLIEGIFMAWDANNSAAYSFHLCVSFIGKQSCSLLPAIK